MKAFMNTELGRGIRGIVISIGMPLAVLLPIALMDVYTKLFDLV